MGYLNRDSTWEKFVKNISGWKLEVLVQGMRHEGFTDLALLFGSLPRNAAKSESGRFLGEELERL